MKHTFRTAAGLITLALFVLSSCATGPKYSEEELPIVQRQFDTLMSEGWVLLLSNDYPNAQETFERALELFPNDPAALRSSGLAAFAQAHISEAVEYFRTSVNKGKHEPESVAVRDFLAAVLPEGQEKIDILSDLSNDLTHRNNSMAVRREGWIELAYVNRRLNSASSNASILEDSLHVLFDWNILGPFQNISHEGFGALPIVDPASPLASTPTAEGDDQRTLHWVPAVNNYVTGLVMPSYYSSNSSYGSYYATRNVGISEAGEYTLVLSQLGAARIWVDGELIYSEPQYRYAVDGFWTKLDLTEGSHSILVNVLNQQYSSGFRLSLIPGDYTESAAGVHAGDPLLTGLHESALESSGFEDADFWYDYMLTVKELPELFRDQLSDITQDSPSELLTLVREFSGIDDVDGGDRIAEYPSIDTVWFLPSVDQFIKTNIDLERYEVAQSIIDGLKENYGLLPQLQEYGIMMAVARDDNDAHQNYLRYRASYPDLVDLDLYLLDTYGSDLRWYGELLDNLKSNSYESDRIEYEYFAALDNNDSKTALSLLGFIRRLYPDSGYYVSEYLDLLWYEGGVSFSAYTDILDELYKSYSGRWTVQEMRERLLAVRLLLGNQGYNVDGTPGNFAEAYASDLENFYDEMMGTRIGDFDMWESMVQLIDDDNRAMYETLETKDVEPIIEMEIDPADYPEADAVQLLNETINLYAPNGARWYYYSGVLRVLTPDGVLAERSQYNPAYGETNGRLHSAYAVKPDGSIIRPIRSGANLSFPSLEVGDSIVMSYSYSGETHGMLRKELWTQVTLNSYYPTVHRWHRIFYPEDLDLQIAAHNTEELEYEQEDIEAPFEMKGISFEAENVDSVPIEFGDIEWQDLYSWVDLSTLEDWTPVRDWYRDMYFGRTRESAHIAALAQQITEGLESERDKLAAIYQYVTYQVEYEDIRFMYSAYVPQQPESVVSDRFGDCKDQSTLLIALLRAVGIEAEIALSNPNYRGENSYLPSTRFNHAFVLAKLDGETIFMDPTTKYYSFPQTPESLRGTYYLEIGPKDSESLSELARVPLGDAPVESSIVHQLSLSSSSALLSSSADYQGNLAAIMRYVTDFPGEQQRLESFSSYLKSYNPGIQLTSLQMNPSSDLTDTAHADFEASLSGALIQVGNGTYGIHLPWMISVDPQNWLWEHGDERNSALLLDDYLLASASVETFEIELTGGRVDFLPPSQRFEFQGIVIEFAYSRSGNTISAERRIHLPSTYVSADAYQDFTRFLLQVLAKQEEMIAVSF